MPELIQEIPNQAETYKDEWNRLATHPLQTWEWGAAREENGTPIVRFVGPDHAGDKAVFQATIHPLPFLRSKHIMYFAKSAIPSPAFLHSLSLYAKSHGMVYAKFEPNATIDEHAHISTQLIRSQAPLFPDWTQTLDLRASEDELMANLKSKTRYNVRLAKKRGVTVTQDNSPEGFATFFSLYLETEKRQHHYGHDEAYHRHVYEKMRPYSHLLIAECDGVPLAAYHLFYHNSTLYYPYGGSSAKNREVMAANLLMWEAIRLGKSLGATSFDMWGSLPPSKQNDTSDPWYGFTRFKTGYGTTFSQSVGSYDLVIDKLLYPPLMTAWKLRSKWLARF
jgi:lipid II:glycine glycyltransferase (peptidoglycan interpeptide bridge formation enzyme)